METLLEPVHNPEGLSSLALAFVGDAVFELMVRRHLCEGGSRPVAKLHQSAVERVRAEAQSRVYTLLEGVLTSAELDIMKRGRNARPHHTPKNADIMEYKRATGVEALFGYLYLSGQSRRLIELFRQIIDSWEA